MVVYSYYQIWVAEQAESVVASMHDYAHRGCGTSDLAVWCIPSTRAAPRAAGSLVVSRLQPAGAMPTPARTPPARSTPRWSPGS